MNNKAWEMKFLRSAPTTLEAKKWKKMKKYETFSTKNIGMFDPFMLLNVMTVDELNKLKTKWKTFSGSLHKRNC